VVIVNGGLRGEQHHRPTNVTTPSIHGFAGTDVTLYGLSWDGMASFPYKTNKSFCIEN
jgi:hypothetical protein